MGRAFFSIKTTRYWEKIFKGNFKFNNFKYKIGKKNQMVAHDKMHEMSTKSVEKSDGRPWQNTWNVTSDLFISFHKSVLPNNQIRHLSTNTNVIWKVGYFVLSLYISLSVCLPNARARRSNACAYGWTRPECLTRQMDELFYLPVLGPYWPVMTSGQRPL